MPNMTTALTGKPAKDPTPVSTVSGPPSWSCATTGHVKMPCSRSVCSQSSAPSLTLKACRPPRSLTKGICLPREVTTYIAPFGPMAAPPSVKVAVDGGGPDLHICPPVVRFTRCADPPQPWKTMVPSDALLRLSTGNRGRKFQTPTSGRNSHRRPPSVPFKHTTLPTPSLCGSESSITLPSRATTNPLSPSMPRVVTETRQTGRPVAMSTACTSPSVLQAYIRPSMSAGVFMKYALGFAGFAS
mmetsp:Transcript_126696/g.358396  ORF Transcript_126696/g.358396 Transcript_126696/m.358396 type:complete len:243 (-) Transcript_126696:186-914(-)